MLCIARKVAIWHAAVVLASMLAAPASLAKARPHPASRAPSAAKRRAPATKQPSFPSLIATSPQPPSPYAPYMGVDTWYAFGARIDEHRIVDLAKAIVATRLKAAGYRYLWLDGGWWNGTRGSDGSIAVSAAQWPHGMAWLAAYIHSLGLLAGIYTDAGAHGCGGTTAGSYGHYQQDVDTFAAWGFDAVKVDYCGGLALQLDPRAAYAAFSTAIASDRPHRTMILNICNPIEPNRYGVNWPPYENSAFDSWSFAPAIATSWRTSFDVGWPGYVPFANVLHNLNADAAHPEAAGHGHLNDPDYIVPGAGLTATESQTQFTMWALLAAPMMISADPSRLSAGSLQMLENPEAIAISQDPLGVQGTRVAQGAAEVWAKPLSGGQKAVAFLNRSSATVLASASPAAIGLPAAVHLAVRNVWQRRTTIQTASVSALVGAHAAVLLRVAGSRNGVR